MAAWGRRAPALFFLSALAAGSSVIAKRTPAATGSDAQALAFPEFSAKAADWAARWEGSDASVAARDEALEDGEEEEFLLRSSRTVLAELRTTVREAAFATALVYAGWAADGFESVAGIGTPQAPAAVSSPAVAPVIAAMLIETVAGLPDCVAELDVLGELETRCTQKWYKIAIQKMFSVGDAAGAERMWRRARRLRRNGRKQSGIGTSHETPESASTVPVLAHGELPAENDAAIPWPSAKETPTIWVRGLHGGPFWDCHSAWPFVRTLEAQAGQILEEARRAAPRLTAAYPYLFARGSWKNIFLYRGRAWNTEVCAEMPHTCNLLIPEIPTNPTIPFVVKNNEEIVLFRSEPGAVVGPHSGATNNQVNIHLTLTGGTGVFLRVGEEQRELRDGKAVCFKDSFLHSLEHICNDSEEACAERLSIVIRVTHPDATLSHYDNALRSDAEGNLQGWNGQAALQTELGRLRDNYRRLADKHSALSNHVEQLERPCGAPLATTVSESDRERQRALALFTFLSKSYGTVGRSASGAVCNVDGVDCRHADGAIAESHVDAIVVLSNWYDRISKVRRVLELAEQHREAHIIVVGGRGRLSSMRAAEMDGEAHATFSRLLVLLEIPGDLGTISTDRITVISCNECKTKAQRESCGCVGNTGFNTDRFLEWAATKIPPLDDGPRQVVFVEESYLVRRVAATVLGRLAGPFGHVHNLTTMQISVLNARDTGDGAEGADEQGLQQVMEAHGEMRGGILHLMADEAIRLDKYSVLPRETQEPNVVEEHSPGRLFLPQFFLGTIAQAQLAFAGQLDWSCSRRTSELATSGVNGPINAEALQEWTKLKDTARHLHERWSMAMKKVSASRQLFWRCVAPRDSEPLGGPLRVYAVDEAPGEAWKYWRP